MPDSLTTSVKMRPPNDPAIQAEVRSLIARMREPGFLGTLAHELVSMREEITQLRLNLYDLEAEDAPGGMPESFSFDANGSEVAG